MALSPGFKNLETMQTWRIYFLHASVLYEIDYALVSEFVSEGLAL